VKSYVEAHGGQVSVRSEPGKGSIFTMVLPIEPPGTPLESSPLMAMPSRSIQ
jgi:two-component system sensor histidine kinase BarA